MLLLRDCHFYYVSDRLPQPLPLSKSFRSTFLRWYLRHFRRRCSPQELNLVLIELSKILQKRDAKSVTLLRPKWSNRPSLPPSFNEDHDLFRPPTPFISDPTEWIVSNSATSSNQSENKLGNLELETDSLEGLSFNLKNTSNPLSQPPVDQMDDDWLRECLEHSPVVRRDILEEQDPVWECFRENLRTGVEMGPSEGSSEPAAPIMRDFSLVIYEKTLVRLLHTEASPDPGPALIMEPVQEQEMEREINEREIQEPELIQTIPTICSCRCARRFRAFYESTLLNKTDTVTNS